ncbi:MAG: hypothetical protein JWQ73_268 [Variovorax sp.]|jgi:two-component system chemotaxis response regulator CheB|nr:hypothetical protein [Variovorax sp.]
MVNNPAVRDIVLIGASRGGLDALARITSALPTDFPAAVLVVLHTSPENPRALDSLVAKKSSLPVAYAQEDEPITQGRVYLAPPDFHLTVRSGARVGLEHSAKVRHSRPAVDVLFESAAEVFRERVVGIILTGGDHDGTDGMKAIGARGGIGIVQSPSEALDPGMPGSAIVGDDPQFIVMLDEIPGLLIQLARSPG